MGHLYVPESYNNIQPASASDAEEFYKQANAQFDHLIIGEQDARDALLISLLTEDNVIFIGAPGGGKSELSGNFYRIFSDINEHQIVQVPADAELSGRQLVGGNMSSTKEITVQAENEKPKTTTEINSVDIESLVDEETAVIWTDEITRANPYALNLLLPAYENGYLSTTEGRMVLRGLLLGVSTMNPSESTQATFTLPAAQASRHARGAIMGLKNDPAKRLEIATKLAGGWEPQPEKVVAFTDRLKLHALKLRAGRLAMEPELTKYLAVMTMAANDRLSELGIEEADGRMVMQVLNGAKGIATLSSREAVTDADIKHSVKATFKTRVGSQKRIKGEKVAEYADEVVDQIAA